MVQFPRTFTSVYFLFFFFFNNGHINGCKVALICISLEMATHSSQRSYLENPRDRGSLVGCCLWGRTESDLTEATQQQQQQQQQQAHVNAFLSLGPIQSFPPLCPHVRSPHVDKKLECSLKWARILV